MNCPTCGNECYDNREKVAGGWKGPIWKCKDTDCAWTKWPPKGQKGQQQSRGNGGGSPASGAPKRPLGPLYWSCMKAAKLVVEKELKGATPADVIAACATLFIAATRDGTPLAAPKPKPKPEPEPEEYDDNDANDFASNGLPF